MNFIVDDEVLQEGLKFLPQYVACDLPYSVRAVHKDRGGYRIYADGKCVTVEYGARHTFYMAVKDLLIGRLDADVPLGVRRLGLMFDCARNAVMNLSSAKRFIVYAALCGYNYLQLYLEDCLKVDDEPFFGYMRGAYSKDELKELVSFATLFGVDMVPCIQTLAHYNQLFRRPEYDCVCDQGDALLIDEPRTYELLENLFKTVRECFTSSAINICMDEAQNAGRGRYLDKHGYVNRKDLLVRHLNRVLELCRKYGFTPFMWSDMLFNAAFGAYYETEDAFPADFLKDVPSGVNYVYWDYYHDTFDDYDRMIKLHKQLPGELCFAGGIWTWRGFTPYNEYTTVTMTPALDACKQNGVQDIFMAMWGDNGGECSRFSVLSSIVWVAEKVHEGGDKTRVNKITTLLSGYGYDDFLKLDLANNLNGGKVETNVNPSKYLLYADPLLSLFDTLVDDRFAEKYAQSYKTLKALADRGGTFSYMFRTQMLLCKILMRKCDLGVKIKAAYDRKDKAALSLLCDTITRIVADVEVFYEAFEAQWSIENRPFGFEVQDVRLGGLLMRLLHVKERLCKFVSGELDRVEELEEARLAPDYKKRGDGKSIVFNDYRGTVTAGNL